MPSRSRRNQQPSLRANGSRECAPRWLAMTVRHTLAISQAAAPRGLPKFPALSELRAQGMPGARCARGLVCNGCGRAHTSIQVTPESPGIPHAMVLTATPCSPPVLGLFGHRHPWKLASQELDTSVEVSGPHVFARPLQMPSSTTSSASTASRPTFRDVAQRPSFGTGPHHIMTGPERRQAIFQKNRK
jgi:hypothetical protein